jgi:hypothetical protein
MKKIIIIFLISVNLFSQDLVKSIDFDDRIYIKDYFTLDGNHYLIAENDQNNTKAISIFKLDENYNIIDQIDFINDSDNEQQGYKFLKYEIVGDLLYLYVRYWNSYFRSLTLNLITKETHEFDVEVSFDTHIPRASSVVSFKNNLVVPVSSFNLDKIYFKSFDREGNLIETLFLDSLEDNSVYDMLNFSGEGLQTENKFYTYVGRRIDSSGVYRAWIHQYNENLENTNSFLIPKMEEENIYERIFLENMEMMRNGDILVSGRYSHFIDINVAAVNTLMMIDSSLSKLKSIYYFPEDSNKTILKISPDPQNGFYVSRTLEIDSVKNDLIITKYTNDLKVQFEWVFPRDTISLVRDIFLSQNRDLLTIVSDKYNNLWHEKLKVYKNPILSVNYGDRNEDLTLEKLLRKGNFMEVTIYGLNGNEVYKGKNINKSIISNLPKGLYIIRFDSKTTLKYYKYE